MGFFDNKPQKKVIILDTITIRTPNISYNTYECYRNTGFLASDTKYMRAKSNYYGYSKPIEYKDFNWDYVKREVELMDWFYSVGISRKDFEYMKSQEFKELEKPYLGKNIKDIDKIPNTALGTIIKKHWALELWKHYNNCYQLSGIRTFELMGDGDEIRLNGDVIKTVPQDYQWKWPEKFGLLR